MALPFCIYLGRGHNFSFVFALQCFTSLIVGRIAQTRYFDILLLNNAGGNRGLLSVRRDGVISPRVIICGKEYCGVDEFMVW